MLMRIFESAIIKGFEGFGNLFFEHDKPQGVPTSEMILGTTAHPYHPERPEKATLDTELRMKHLYVLGGTGAGKTKLIESLIQQDILSRNGFALIDPHGDLTRHLLSFFAKNFEPSEMDDLGKQLILIEPFNRDWACGFNPLEALGGHFPAMLELIEIFRRFWGNSYWGPRMDELLRHTIITLADNNLTLLEARPLLTHKGFRERMIRNLSFGEVRDYWLYRYNPLSEGMQSIYRESVLNKISAFVTDPSIYRILGQKESTVNFRKAMDQEKWILLNLSKGQLKENIRLLGTLFLAKIKQSAFSRVDTLDHQRRPFFIYVDEFQNFIGNDFEEILSESRKYGVGLTIAHQNLDQIPRELRSVILGNVGTEIFFKLSHYDASQVSGELDQKERHLIERNLVDLKVREAYLKVKGQKQRLLRTSFVPSIHVSGEIIERIKRASFRYWTRPVEEVERQIQERRQLWINDGTMVRSRSRESKVRPLRDYTAFSPGGRFEEGQNDW